MDLREFRSALLSCFGARPGKTLRASAAAGNASKPTSPAGDAAKLHTYDAAKSVNTARCGGILTFLRTARSFFTGESSGIHRNVKHEQSATAGAPPPAVTDSAKSAPLSTVNIVDIDREESLAALSRSQRDFSHTAFTGNVSGNMDLWYLHQIAKRYESQEAKPDMKGVQVGFYSYNSGKCTAEYSWNLAPAGTERETRESLEAIKALMDLGAKPTGTGKPLTLYGDISAKPKDPSQSTDTGDAAPASTLELLFALKRNHPGLISLDNVHVTARLGDAVKDSALMEQLKQARKLGAQVALEEQQDLTMTLGTLRAVKELVDVGVSATEVSFKYAAFRKEGELEEARRLQSTIDRTKVDMKVVDAQLGRSRS